MESSVCTTFFTLIVLMRMTGLGVSAQQLPECDENPFVWRNNNQTCPPRAVCADVFDTARNWYNYRNRESCMEHRTLHNCMCPGEDGSTSPCPVGNDNNRLYSSRNHKLYTCHATCTLPYCANLNQDRTNTAVRLVEEDPQFGDRNYYRMECRCPRHHFPSQVRGVQRAVYPYSSVYNYRTHQYMTLYRCRNVGAENRMSDPCAE